MCACMCVCLVHTNVCMCVREAAVHIVHCNCACIYVCCVCVCVCVCVFSPFHLFSSKHVGSQVTCLSLVVVGVYSRRNQCLQVSRQWKR